MIYETEEVWELKKILYNLFLFQGTFDYII